MTTRRRFLAGLCAAGPAAAQEPPVYDLLLKGGQVLDPKNSRRGRFDIGIVGGKIARVAADLPAAHARQAVAVDDYFVVPGLVDIHARLGVGGAGSGIQPDHNTLPYGVTTVVDAGSFGCGNFEAFQAQAVGKAKARVLAWLNIAADAAGGLDAEACAATIRKHRDSIAGVSSGRAQGWEALDRAMEAGRLSETPVMVSPLASANGGLAEVLKRMRPGDIYTHIYGSAVPALDTNRKVAPAVWASRKRGVRFDVGHGENFWFRIALPAIRQGFLPDTISTGMDKRSIMIPRANMMHTLSKFLNMGLTFEQTIERSTWNAARAIGRPDLGHLTEGAPADVAVLQIDKGAFGFVDAGHARLPGDRKLRCALTVRDGAIAWDADGLSLSDWRSVGPYSNFK